MANYSIVTQYPDVEVIGGAQTQDVQVIGVLTAEHSVYFEIRLPRASATTAFIRQEANAFTIIYELVFTAPGVSDVQWTQEPTAGGLLEDHVIVYVTSTSGNSTGVLDFSYGHFNQDYIGPKVAALRTALDNTEGT